MNFRDEYYFLSNMFPVNIRMKLKDGNSYAFNNAEAAFQAQKNLEYAKQFEGIDGFAAKKLGRSVPLAMSVSDWNNSDRIKAMINAEYAKYNNADLLAKLQAVNEPIVEDNSWGDTFWGVSNGVGQNVLGQILTNIKENNNSPEALRILFKNLVNK